MNILVILCGLPLFSQCFLFILGVVVGHYLQSVSKSADLGAELAYQYGPQVPGGEIAVLSLAGRYTGKSLPIFCWFCI